MADLSFLNFNTEYVPDIDEDFGLVPPGFYEVAIVGTELKSTAKGGKMLVLQYQISRGEYVGRIVFERLNIVNSNEKATQIAMGTMKKICEAVGIKGKLQHSEKLHSKTMVIKVEQREYQGNDGASRRSLDVKRHLSKAEAAAVSGGGTTNQNAPIAARSEATENSPEAQNTVAW